MGNSLGQQSFHSWITSAEPSVTEYDEVSAGGDAVFRIWRLERDGGLPELSAHGWVNLIIRTRNLMPLRLGEKRDAAHQRATDTQNMHMHVRVPRPSASWRVC